MGHSVTGLADLQILVVEDEAMIVMMLEDLLEDFGCVVRTAPTIETALASLRSSAPDGVLLDMNIQGKRPVELAEELIRLSVPFLLVTGYGPGNSDPAVIQAAPRLQKPFSRAELATRMKEVFVGHANRLTPSRESFDVAGSTSNSPSGFHAHIPDC